MDVSQVACAMGRGVGMCPICETFALHNSAARQVGVPKKNLGKIAKNSLHWLTNTV